ncbi:hypothetical protein NCS56_01144000 [Fusarium sp. Ph1]|nr:hypothetical protein NCS56_01144000 [Fusarium sp. Ph1]
MVWHRRLGHPGPRSLEHLMNHTFGVKIKGLVTVECDVCGLAKMKRQEHREPRERASKPGERVSLDFHDYPEGINDYTSCGILTDRESGLCWDYYFVNRQEESLLAMLKHFTQMLDTMYDIKLRVIETDNELQKAKLIRGWLTEKGIRVDESAPRTQQQNGSGERSGGLVKEKVRLLIIDSNLPAELWPEMMRTAVYLLNRTPKQGLHWKTPYESFFSGIPHAQEQNQPRIGHIRTIGSKAFALTDSAQRKDKRLLSRTNPKAWIGFLVGYNSQNIFRVWNPVTNKIYITRDVIFNEQEFFNANEVQMRDTIGEQTLEEIQQRLQALLSTQQVDQVMDPVQSPDEQEMPDSSLESLIEDLPNAETESTEDTQVNDSKYTQARFEILPTPPESPFSSFLAQIGSQTSQSQDEVRRSKEDLLILNQAFYAGTMAVPIARKENELVSKATRSRCIRGKLKPKCETQMTQTHLKPDRQAYHRKNLPPAPSSHGSLIGHRFEAEFKQAQRDHLESHRQMSSWTEIARCDPRIRNSQILDCMWVFTYKFDKHGYLQKCKARLVVRGDQQQKSSAEDTYAATLAGKSFRTMLAIAARFDLELLQYDAVNAFVNAKLQSNVFMKLPPGFRGGHKEERVLLLHKALYGLRVAPLLWQTELGSTLRSSGCREVPDEPCCYQKDGVFIFFYVDDIVVAFKKGDRDTASQVIESLKGKYKLTGGHELQWFLGMEIIRDRTSRRIWVTQIMYLEKIYELRTADAPNGSPMMKEELVPNEGEAIRRIINWYKRVIGSILYASVISRPDVAFAISRLARFMNNPGEKHVQAANRVLCYLYATRFYALQFGPGEGFVVHSDASFADNTIDRKSSQGFAMMLFGSLIGWRANKQDTVTTSTTEAELLGLSQAAKEGLFQQRLLRSLELELQNTDLHLVSDNEQTIRLLKSPLGRLKTKLKHVDVHNHWLREHIQNKAIFLSYKESAKLIADGLTKALQGGRQRESCKQYGLIDIRERITKRRNKMLKERTFEEIMDELQL